jgi:hypothetical protein
VIDIKKSLTGIQTLKPGVVPSKFQWSGASSVKRKPPKMRESSTPNPKIACTKATNVSESEPLPSCSSEAIIPDSESSLED